MRVSQAFGFGGLLVCAALLSGCASNQPPATADNRAQQIMLTCARSEGIDALLRLNDINIHLQDQWNPLAAGFDPVLVDSQYRRASDEHYHVHETISSQTFKGPGGVKEVFRDDRAIRVWYNGKESQDPQTRDAAALVADSYRMFLLGPGFFAERKASLAFIGRSRVDGYDCDELSGMLAPGLGNSAGDSIELSIDRNLHYLRRLRMTPQGLASARNHQVDIFLRDYVKKDGVAWPTSFYEQIDDPMIQFFVHQWHITEIDVDRGLGHLRMGP
jgi:hypothetical protein